MHAATIAGSDRLRRVLLVLADGKAHTTRDIIEQAHVCAVNSCVAELKANGIGIDCRCIGRGRFEYRMEAEENVLGHGL